MTPFLAELVGTMLLILLGDGVVAAVLLGQSKAQNAGWIVITWGWAVAVFVGVYSVVEFSDAHLNPAISLAFAVIGKLPWDLFPVYAAAQMLGAFLGAVLVWATYLPHWPVTDNPDAKLSVFCTMPAIRQPLANLVTEIVATAVLLFGALSLAGPKLVQAAGAAGEPLVNLQAGALGAVPVSLLVLGIGLSLGGPTGYAINPARDLGPRLAHALLPIPGKRDSDWGYAAIPVAGPLLGGVLGALLFQLTRAAAGT